MTEELLDELKAGWRRQAFDLVGVRHRLHRARIQSYMALAADVICTIVGTAAGVTFGVMAYTRNDWLFGLSAVMFLVIYPPFVIARFRAHRHSLKWVDRTPEGTLLYALTRLRAKGTILELSFWGGVALLGFTVVVWAAAFAGLIKQQYPLGIISAAWVAAGLITISWSKWRMRQNNEERLTGERLLGAFVNATDMDLK